MQWEIFANLLPYVTCLGDTHPNIIFSNSKMKFNYILIVYMLLGQFGYFGLHVY
jgi:hypothetical protein